MNAPKNLRPHYSVDRRTVGYAVNDGRLVVQRTRPSFWSPWGTLQLVGTSKVLGVVDTQAEADALVEADLVEWLAAEHEVRAAA